MKDKQWGWAYTLDGKLISVKDDPLIKIARSMEIGRKALGKRIKYREQYGVLKQLDTATMGVGWATFDGETKLSQVYLGEVVIVE